jgi:hypothetical protein
MTRGPPLVLGQTIHVRDGGSISLAVDVTSNREPAVVETFAQLESINILVKDVTTGQWLGKPTCRVPTADVEVSGKRDAGLMPK